MRYLAARARFAGGKSCLMVGSGIGEDGGVSSNGGEGGGDGIRGSLSSSVGGEYKE